MGKHWGNSSSEQAVRSRIIAVRCISGGFCLSLAVLTFGVQGLSGTGSAAISSPSLASGFVGPDALDPGTAGAAGPGIGAPASPAFTADALALVAYTRSTVGTVSKDGVPGELNVASAGLKRPAEGFLMAPLESLQESSSFGLRTSPITGSAGEFHWGQDYAAACGTRVYSADAGVVRAVGWHPWGGGNRVEIDHGNGLITTYNHLEAIAVQQGDSVRVGEVIARVGTTGSSTGCHLHFETILNGSHTNPDGWTLLPIKQTDRLGTIAMTSYAPDAGQPANAAIGWAVPVSDDRTHEVTGGIQELPIAALPELPTSTPTPDALSPTKTRPATPTPDGTATPGGSQPPSGTPSPSEPGAATPTPTPTPPTTTPTPTPTTPATPPTTPPTTTPTTPPTTTTPAPTPPTTTPAPTPAPTPPTTTPAPTPTAPSLPPSLPFEPTGVPALPPPVVAPPLPPEPEPTSVPALPAPTLSTEPTATADPSLSPGP